jgi:hypothetical protein
VPPFHHLRPPDGFELAKNFSLEFLDGFKTPKPEAWKDREFLTTVARTSLRTKLAPAMADQLTVRRS